MSTSIPITGKLTPMTSDGYIAESKYIKNGYIVVQTLADLNNLLDTTIYVDKTFAKGAPVYVASLDKTYRYSAEESAFVEDPELKTIVENINTELIERTTLADDSDIYSLFE